MNSVRPNMATLPLRFFRAATAILFASVCIFVLGCENPSSLIGSILRSPISILGLGQAEAPGGQDSDASADDSYAAAKLVEGWEIPDLTLFVTGRLHGYIEPCGCTGLTNQKGGLLRRHTCLNLLKSKGFDPVTVDAGNMIRRFGQQPSIKMKTAYKSIAQIMNYDVIGMGVDDMKAGGVDMLLSMEEAGRTETPFTSANMKLFEGDPSITPFQVIEKNGKTIGVASVIGAEHVKKAMASGGNEDFSLEMPAAAIAAVVGNPKFAACDFKVLMIQSEPESCKMLAMRFPVFDLVVTAGGAGDPTLKPEAIALGNGRVSQMIQCGVKGMYVGVVGVDFGGDGSKAIKYQRVALDASFKDSPPVKEVFLEYQNELKALWQGGSLEDIKPRLHPSGYKFVGSQACRDCHDEEYDIWKDGIDGDGGPHAKATADLTDPGERTWVKRHFDPECVSCHVTGWNPQNYYPYETGYIDLKKDVLLHGNGCENCHGPGSGHVQAENDATDQALQDKLRLQVRVTIAEAKARTCYECHDLDNSPDYAEAEDGWDKYWPTIKHGDGE
ncbi:multiheme c-type cytochrome [Mariniblastus fucicola]|nr:multiheme c-type cytochrome [Mariniblastus fucicola]